MDHSLSLDGATNAVQLTVHTEVDADRFTELIAKSATMLGRESSKKLLVVHATGLPSATFMESYNYASSMPHLLPKGTRVANICPEDSLEEAKFLDTVAMNRGLTMQSFDSAEDARDWLSA